MERNQSRRFVVLDFYRFVAAVGVFIFHLKTIDNGISPAWNGSFGLFVDMFFILSGFVIAYSYPATSGGVRSYFRFMVRRLARIYPLHVLTLLAFTAVVLVRIESSTPQSDKVDFIYNLLLVQAWGITDHLSFNSPAWSISAELFCYLLFPLLMFIATAVRPLALALIVAVSYGILAHGHLTIWHDRSQMYGANFDFGMLRALPSFLNGILLAFLFNLSGSYRKKPVVVAGIAVFLTALLVLNIYAKPDLAIILFSLAILITAVGESAFEWFPGSAWLGRLGNTSYAIYMLHELLIVILFGPMWRYLGLPPASFPIFLFLCCVVITIVADLAYNYIENPARRLINRRVSAGPRPIVALQPEPQALDLRDGGRAAAAR